MLIGFVGPAGTGKDTAADHLVEEFGFVKMSLADEMKRICLRIYNFTQEQLWGPSEKRNALDLRYPREDGTYLSPRIALQVLGTEFGRACYKNTWVDFTVRIALNVLKGWGTYTQLDGWDREAEEFDVPKGVVIPDCRFQNEIDAIHKAGGIVIRLKRKTEVDALTIGVKNHASETEQLSIPDSAVDYVVDVASGVENFKLQLNTLMEKL